MTITSLVKPADLLKRAPTDSAATGPKRRSLCLTILMDKVVQQVSILRNCSHGPRLGIIRTKDRGQSRISFEYLHHSFDRPGWNNNISVHEEDDLAPGM